MHVIVRGRLTVYEPRGEYQVVLDYLEPKGIGALQMAFEQLKDKLAREGLFDSSRKRPLPLLPRCIGIVTSLSGAAIKDILSVLHRRCSILKVMIVPVAVQGDGAADQIAHAIRALSLSGDVDVIIVGRGGGSWKISGALTTNLSCAQSPRHRYRWCRPLAMKSIIPCLILPPTVALRRRRQRLKRSPRFFMIWYAPSRT